MIFVTVDCVTLRPFRFPPVNILISIRFLLKKIINEHKKHSKIILNVH